MLKQKTLQGSFSLCGKGLHTGLNLTVTFNPAPENHGYKIQRIDLDGRPIIDAVAENVVETTRGTVLGRGEARCSTVEHALAALYAMGVDNCLLQVNGPEVPILDGSAEIYVENIKRVGIAEQNAVKDYYIIRKKLEVKDEETGSCITILPDEQFSITAMISFNSKVLSSQFATLDNMENFESEIAPSRTFVFVREVEQLMAAGLIKGGDLDNAIVIYENEMSQEKLDKLADSIGVPHHDATEKGYLNHKPLVWENEPARHKLLDIIGDMALIGKPIKGRIIATRPGHTINNKFARQMRKEIRLHEIQAPGYDCNEPPVMDVNRIRELLPHRYPMQLVDKVIELGPTTIVAVKNVTSNEPFFTGHFPQEPVMPGVLQIEAMAQAGGLLVLNSVDEPERWSTYFLRIDQVKFRQKVVPGDTLLFKVELLAPVRHGISSMRGYVFVGESIVNSVSVLYGARIGNGNVIFPGAVISAVPQDLKFQGEDTTAEVGDNNKIRENVTINRGTAAKGKTCVGSGNLLMESVHVAHDAFVGNDCIIGNGTKLAGEIIIDDHAIISANVLMHQFCRVGGYTMVGGGTRFSQDIPPYTICAREPVAYCGLNLVGLRRRGFSNELIENIHNAYRIIYQGGVPLNEALQKVREEVPASPEINYIIEFIENSKRGFVH